MATLKPPTLATPRRCRGLSLVELMIGLALGLFILATALLLLSHHLRENRGLLLEARMMQDLRLTADMMARHLRRAGSWGEAQAGIWRDDAPAMSNPYLPLAPAPASAPAAAAAADTIIFQYSRDAVENHLVDSNEQFGFRLRRGVVELRLGDGGWQALTDPQVMTITDLQLQPQVQEQSLASLCHRPCPVTPVPTLCPPRHQVRSLAIKLQAQAASDVSRVRSLQTTVRLRNDAVLGQCPA